MARGGTSSRSPSMFPEESTSKPSYSDGKTVLGNPSHAYPLISAIGSILPTVSKPVVTRVISEVALGSSTTRVILKDISHHCTLTGYIAAGHPCQAHDP